MGMRLHSLIYSAIGNVPLIGIAYDPKIRSFMEYTSQKLCVDVKELNGSKGKMLADELFRNYDEIRSTLGESYKKLKGMAQSNGKIAVDLYEKGSAEVNE